MAFKDEWIPQDDTMPADASVVNAIANEVIRIGENGGGGGWNSAHYDHLSLLPEHFTKGVYLGAVKE